MGESRRSWSEPGFELPFGPRGRMLSVAGKKGEQHEQGRSRQPPPQQGWRNQRQTWKHPDPNLAKGLRTEFRSRLPRNGQAERGLAEAKRDVAQPASPGP